MLGAAAILGRDFQESQFVLPLADTVDAGLVEKITRGYPVAVRLLPGQMYDAVGISDAAMVASGTATLETALLETPMVIAYRISPLTAAVGKRVVRVEHIGLVNIIAGKTVVPERVQDDATAEKLATEVKAILCDRARYDAIRKDLSGVREKLGEPGASRRAAAIALGLMERGTRDQSTGTRAETK